MNLGREPRGFSYEKLGPRGSIVLATTPNRESEGVTGSITIHGNESVIVALE